MLHRSLETRNRDHEPRDRSPRSAERQATAFGEPASVAERLRKLDLALRRGNRNISRNDSVT